jgi:hypothetical protein
LAILLTWEQLSNSKNTKTWLVEPDKKARTQLAKATIENLDANFDAQTKMDIAEEINFDESKPVQPKLWLKTLKPILETLQNPKWT